MNGEAEVGRARLTLMQPNDADITRAKLLLLERLRLAGQVAATTLVEQVLQDWGVQRSSGPGWNVAVEPQGALPTDAEQPQVRYLKVDMAVRTACAELIADGLITTVVGGHRGIMVTGGSTNFFVPLYPPTVPGQGHDADVALTRRALLWEGEELDDRLEIQDLGGLLGRRGERYVLEAVTAQRRGLHLAAVNLLGAANEAAWYVLGEAVRSRSNKLGKELDAPFGKANKVIEYTAETLRQVLPGRSGDVEEIQAHGGYLRRLRNYGLHPRDDVDDAEESAFTEAGAAVLLAAAGNYLRRMATLRNAATAKLAKDAGA